MHVGAKMNECYTSKGIVEFQYREGGLLPLYHHLVLGVLVSPYPSPIIPSGLGISTYPWLDDPSVPQSHDITYDRVVPIDPLIHIPTIPMFLSIPMVSIA